MYIDKDKSGKISIMEVTEDEAKDIRAILFEFEKMVNHSFLSESDQARLIMFSAKLRFGLIDVLE